MSANLEDGYTRIANEILERLATIKLSPTQFRTIFIIWRFTYGFKRKEHDLSLKFIATATGCDKRQLQRELKDLEDRRIIYQRIKNGAYRIIGFNKNYEEWNQSIGETTNGEVTNGGITNGETTNGTIGETTNQERKKITTTEEFGTETMMDIYTKVFGNFIIQPLIADYFNGLRRKGFTEAFIKELLLEVGHSSTRPNLNLLQTIGDRWIKAGIYTRVEAKRQREADKLRLVPDPKDKKRDPDLIARDREIALNQYVAKGGNPDEFRYDTATGA